MKFKQKRQSFTGIVAGTSIDDYKNNVIKKHEDTLAISCGIIQRLFASNGF
jgi:uncharacterized protein (DUF1015 family)